MSHGFITETRKHVTTCLLPPSSVHELMYSDQLPTGLKEVTWFVTDQNVHLVVYVVIFQWEREQQSSYSV